MSPFNEEGTISALEIDRAVLPNTGYTVLIVDLWEGDRDDPRVAVNRYQGLFASDVDLEDYELRSRYSEIELRSKKGGESSRYGDVEGVLSWEHVHIVKEKDDRAQRMASEEELLDPNSDRGRYSVTSAERDLYQEFLNAIDTLAVDYGNEKAWEAIDAWRSVQAMKHER